HLLHRTATPPSSLGRGKVAHALISAADVATQKPRQVPGGVFVSGTLTRQAGLRERREKMSDQTIDCEFRKPASPEEWQRYHDIRRRNLFDPYFPGIVYDPDHPDERREGHHPRVLILDGRVAGTIRIDVLDAARVCFRLVAIDERLRGQGLGAELLRRAERFAVASLGRSEAVLFAHRNARGFYLKQGYAPVASWGETPLDRNSVPVGKRIGQAAD